ncbi:MAG: hypothetical protein UX77_C0010G0053 [Parcubacteria group bacterium GW2011_GWA1_47_11]|uniref:PsbP C-terminal domain-containing protein n=1 Tax=Candidatus Yanofskybacteria bacterium RIFCSPHIGHO2_01_FULL_48_25b TaxID=1802672 RepID=A0A1F8EZZ6_9BACT|nr:MAG: hypothetical protein UX77_C0010G0053 [Parcubacteria group bacterium GW2011_GWA1_47_11]OGN06457.1 MAG: hypothetical protein A2669_01695 [Candidatus Yanofskybacteria bacterium RIFCSPHIGHO2_01_FULL_48_25b]
MAENNTKLTKPQLIIGAAVLVIILFFVFSKKPVTEQAPNLQEQNKTSQEVEQKVGEYFTDNSSWKEFNSPVGKFKATFPAYPTHKTENFDIPGTGLALKYDTYTVQTSDGTTYAVNTTVYPSGVDVPDQEIVLEAGLNGMLATSDRFKLISSSLTYHNGHRALDFFVTNNEMGYFKGKIIAAEPTFYQVMIGCISQSCDENNYNKFINSFVIQ